MTNKNNEGSWLIQRHVLTVFFFLTLSGCITPPGALAKDNSRDQQPSETSIPDNLLDNAESAYTLEALVKAAGKEATLAEPHSSEDRSVLQAIGRNGQQHASQEKKLRSENRSLKKQLNDLQEQLANKQSQASAEEVSTLSASVKSAENKIKGLDIQLNKAMQQVTDTSAALRQQEQALADQKSQDEVLKTQLVAAQRDLKERTGRFSALTENMTRTENEKTQLGVSLSDTQSQLKEALMRAASAQKADDVKLETSEQQQAYVVGQAMAASLRDRLQRYTEAGINLEKKLITTGLTDGLHEHQRMSEKAMDVAWKAFSDTLQQQILTRVKQSEALIAKKNAGRKPTKIADGITFYTLKKGKSVDAQDAPHTLLMTEETAVEGRIISKVPQLTLNPDDDMPALVRDALPLMGPGAEVEAYALAKTIYGDKPLPDGIAPYTVLIYHLKELQPAGS